MGCGLWQHLRDRSTATLYPTYVPRGEDDAGMTSDPVDYMRTERLLALGSVIETSGTLTYCPIGHAAGTTVQAGIWSSRMTWSFLPAEALIVVVPAQVTAAAVTTGCLAVSSAKLRR